MNDNHIELLKNIFLTLIRNGYFLPENWFHQYVFKLEDYSGGIDELSKKISNIRRYFLYCLFGTFSSSNNFPSNKSKIFQN